MGGGVEEDIHSSFSLETVDSETSNGDSSDDEVCRLVLGRAKSDANDNADAHIGKKGETIGTNRVVASTDVDNSAEQVNAKGTSGYCTETNSVVPPRLAVQPLDDKIKDLGRKARARTEEERQKRKTIQVIDDDSVLIAKQAKKGTSKVSASNAPPVKNSKIRQRPKTHNKNTVGAQWLWTPDVSHINAESFHNKRHSAYVLLHGLPVGSTLELVRKFFTGLVPEKVLLLLSNRVGIWALDANSYDSLSLHNLEDAVYTHHDVRVVVRFSSVSAAKLAVERSGEGIFSKFLGSNVDETMHGRLPEEFSIGVTPVTKKVAGFLSKLSIDALPGVPFHDCLSFVESKLQPMVREILWSIVEKQCNLAVDETITSCNILLTEGDIDADVEAMRIMSFPGYKKHARHYNRLLRMYNGLMLHIPYAEDPRDMDKYTILKLDPTVRLAAFACMVLDEEMDRIDNLLHQCRLLRNLKLS